MKAVILAGGYGTRLSEETHLRPKPMVEIGGMPILWHIMKCYTVHGITEFVICCGYKGYCIKEYFANYFLYMTDVTFDIANNSVTVHQKNAEPWKVTVVDTGLSTMTGGRLRRVREYIGDETFCMTYGDGVSDVNISELIGYHHEQGTYATLTAVQPGGRYGMLQLLGNKAMKFVEKPQGDGGWVNGGFFVLSPEVLDYIEDDATVWEESPLKRLAEEEQLSAYKHQGFWMPMDKLIDKRQLEEYWDAGKAPWKTWS